MTNGAVPQPRFADIQNLMDILVPPNDPNINNGHSTHKRFWRNPPTNTRDGFVNFDVKVWSQGSGVQGPLVTPGTPQTSNFYLALAGQAPFDGTRNNPMPDVNSDFNAISADQSQLDMVATWIRNGAPA
jgi:hypothetical protein